MAQICHDIQEWVEREVRKPIQRRRTERREKCKKKKCKKWCLCCNKWCCWIETFVYWVTEWVVRIVGEWAIRVVCEAIHTNVKILIAITVIGVAVFLILPLVTVAVINSFTTEGFPVHGNWCGPGYGGDELNVPPPTDAVDAACMRHDLCYAKEGYLSCKCDVTLVSELPAAIASEASKGNVEATAAGETVLTYFIAQSSSLSCPIVEPIRGVGDAVNYLFD